ncbi:MAG: DUF2309 domain-containing protein, partial [Nitrospira sp.]|nr:DUF2309 domain-containing protein [Nitrospira sp.]
MAELEHASDIESRRMELRGIVRLAGEVIAQYWPMRTFVHHNPLHGIEYLSFEEAVRRGKQFLSGSGYLPSQVYRKFLRAGRIQPHHLDDALKPLTIDKQVLLGTHTVTHATVLRACLAEGLCSLGNEPLDDQLPDPSRRLIDDLAARLKPVMVFPDLAEQIDTTVRRDEAALGRWLTLSHWCDETLGTQIVQQINDQLIKWCEAFLDEGHATWTMPEREKGLYGAWKAIAAHEWSVCDIKDSRKKIQRLPDYPEDALLENLDAMGIPSELRQDYLSLQLTALPGWAGFIKWRGEERDYPWQQAYPAGLVKFLAIRQWYARELVQKACQEVLGIEGRFDAVADYMHSHAEEYYLRRQRVAGRLPALYAEEVDRLAHHRSTGWKAVLERYRMEVVPRQEAATLRGAAKKLLSLVGCSKIEAVLLNDCSSSDLKQLVDWMENFPESEHGPVWLHALESSYQEHLLGELRARPYSLDRLDTKRPYSQSVYCIDVRSEPFRRHLESMGPHETYGFAGFFAAFIRYRAWGK